MNQIHLKIGVTKNIQAILKSNQKKKSKTSHKEGTQLNAYPLPNSDVQPALVNKIPGGENKSKKHQDNNTSKKKSSKSKDKTKTIVDNSKQTITTESSSSTLPSTIETNIPLAPIILPSTYPPSSIQINAVPQSSTLHITIPPITRPNPQ